MREFIRSDKFLAWMFGVGLTLFAFHSPILTPKNDEGETLFFLPQFALMLLMAVSLILYLNNRITKDILGPKKLWIPLLVIATSPLVNALVNWDYHAFAGGLFGLCLFAFYLVARILGANIYHAFIPVVIIESISLVIQGIWIKSGVPIGGIVSPTNWDMASGILVFGMLVCLYKRQWILVTTALIGLYFSGSSEGIFALGVLGITVIWRRDWSKRLIICLGVVAIVAISWTTFGQGVELYERFWVKVEAGTSGSVEETNAGWGKRLEWNERAVTEATPFGHAFEIYHYYNITGVHVVHNVPLVILDQVGIFAFLAWIWVTVYCFFKTRWKYAWIGLLSLCVFDHFIWTCIAPYWWTLVGVSTISFIQNDLIFKQNNTPNSNEMGNLRDF